MARRSACCACCRAMSASGKTVVALLALAAAVESRARRPPSWRRPKSWRASISRRSSPLRQAAGITHRPADRPRQGPGPRRDPGARSPSGEIDLLIGTHALFQEGVAFKDLGLVVIDEQHRFGVHQRLALQAKDGPAADLLVMTATPIPRTLALTVYGDMDVSQLTEKPAGRQPVDTRTMPIERAGRGDRRPVDRVSPRAAAPIGCARWSRKASRRSRRRRGPLRGADGAASATASVSFMGA